MIADFFYIQRLIQNRLDRKIMEQPLFISFFDLICKSALIADNEKQVFFFFNVLI